MDESRSHWSGRRVLITGAGGFIGSHLAERLVYEGAKVRAFIHYNALGRCGWLDESSMRAEVEIFMGDIQDRDRVMAACDGVQTVFHLAALIGIPYSYHAPLSYVRTNVEGTLNVLQAARAIGLERVVHTSTSEVYGSAQYVPMDEAHPLVGQSPYSASKIAADMLVEAFHRSFGIPTVTVRPFNTYGPRQSMRAIIPSVISQCLAGRGVALGNTAPSRDFNYISDTVAGFLLAGMEPAAIGKVFNLGTGQETTIADLASIIGQMAGQSGGIKLEQCRQRPEASEVVRLVADANQARKVLGWEPAYDLRKGLELTIEWFRRWQADEGGGGYVL